MDYYQLLGVSRNASEEAIRRAFHARLRVTHPDVNREDGLADQKTRRLIEAYRTLTDPRARRQYDLFTAPVSTEAPIVVPTVHVMEDHAPPSPWLSRAWIVLILVAVVVGLAVHIHQESNRLVFRPLLIDGELPSATYAQTHPPLVEPNPLENVEWYHTQQYMVNASDSWATSQMILAYKRAADEAKSKGDTPRAEFYRSAVERVSRIYL